MKRIHYCFFEWRDETQSMQLCEHSIFKWMEKIEKIILCPKWDCDLQLFKKKQSVHILLYMIYKRI